MVQKWAFTSMRSVGGSSLNHREKSITGNELRTGGFGAEISEASQLGMQQGLVALSSESCS